MPALTAQPQGGFGNQFDFPKRRLRWQKEECFRLFDYIDIDAASAAQPEGKVTEDDRFQMYKQPESAVWSREPITESVG